MWVTSGEGLLSVQIDSKANSDYVNIVQEVLDTVEYQIRRDPVEFVLGLKRSFGAARRQSEEVCSNSSG